MQGRQAIGQLHPGQQLLWINPLQVGYLGFGQSGVGRFFRRQRQGVAGIGQQRGQVDTHVATAHLVGGQRRQQQHQRAFTLLFAEFPDQSGKAGIQRANPAGLLPLP